jgi:hypothetical protein
MTIEKSFDWLFKRFQTPNTIKPCKFDFDCLTFLAEWCNREKENNIQENVLFAKLFCYVFIQEIQHYKDIEFAQKSMKDILTLDLHSHYQLFTQKLNDVEFNKYLISIGIDPEKRFFDDSDKLKEAEKYFESVNKWSEEQVEKSLNAQITETINRYQNLK